MNTKKINALLVWKQLDDDVVPQLRLSVIDRAVYSYLLRHSRLEGKLRLHFSLRWLASGTRLCSRATRQALHRLLDHGVLRLIECGQTGHLVHIRLPDEISGVRVSKITATAPIFLNGNLETTDFMKNSALREVIHARERGRCFYCLRRIKRRCRCLDHVIPRAKLGRNSYRNLVSCCVECNSKKAEISAEEFLRWLYRERRLSPNDLRGRLRDLDALAAGKLKPAVPGREDTES